MYKLIFAFEKQFQIAYLISFYYYVQPRIKIFLIFLMNLKKTILLNLKKTKTLMLTSGTSVGPMRQQNLERKRVIGKYLKMKRNMIRQPFVWKKMMIAMCLLIVMRKVWIALIMIMYTYHLIRKSLTNLIFNFYLYFHVTFECWHRFNEACLHLLFYLILYFVFYFNWCLKKY